MVTQSSTGSSGCILLSSYPFIFVFSLYHCRLYPARIQTHTVTLSYSVHASHTTLCVQSVFSIWEQGLPASLLLILLLLAGDVEVNPGPPTRETHTRPLNILQININSIKKKVSELRHLLERENVHVALIQETKLTHSTPTPTLKKYSCLRRDRPNSRGGGLLTYIHKDLQFVDTTADCSSLLHLSTTDPMELSSIKLQHANRLLNIINIYIPPASCVDPTYKPDISPLTDLGNVVICGDTNGLHPLWLKHQKANPRGQLIHEQLSNVFILNNRSMHTRTPYARNHQTTSPDISACSPNLSLFASWKTIPSLPSDHLPILISFSPNKTRRRTETNRPTLINYKKAKWDEFTDETEKALLNFKVDAFPSLNKAVKSFNSIIHLASNKYIPKGNRADHIHNYSPEISENMKLRGKLKSKLNPTGAEIKTINHLNDVITSSINQEKTREWQEFLNTIDHKTSSKSLWRTLKKIHTSKTAPPHTHEAMQLPNKCIPTLKQQANMLIDHYARISHKLTHKEN